MARTVPIAAAAGVVAVALGSVLFQGAYRTGEVELAGVLVRTVTTSGVYVAGNRQTVYFGLGSDTPFGLRITPECTSAFLLLPLLFVGAVMILLRPAVLRRVLAALVVTGVLVVLINQFRVLLLVGLIGRLGSDRGYYWGHTLFGSMVSVLGGAAALILFVWLATRHPRAGPATVTA